MSKEGAVVLTAEEKLQRQSDQISYVLNSMIAGKRKLYGSMMRDARSAFMAIDKDGSGSLDYQEFGAFLTRLGLGLKQEQMDELARVMDTSGDGEIDCDEFVAALEAAAKRAKEDEEAKKRQMDAEDESIRATIAAQNAQPEPEVELTEIERMRARIAKTRRSREEYSYQLAQDSLSNAAGFSTSLSQPLQVPSESRPLRVTLPGTHGVTITIGTPEPEPEPEQSPLERSMLRSSGFTSGEIAAFTATDYIEAIDDMDAEEVVGACEHWGISTAPDDEVEADVDPAYVLSTESVAGVDVMRARLRQHYLTMHGGTAAEVPDEDLQAGWAVDDTGDDAAVQMTEAVAAEAIAAVILSAGDVSVVEEVAAEEEMASAVPEEAVHAAVEKVYAGMDVEKQDAAVAAALNPVEDSEEEEGEEGGEASEVEEEEEDEDEAADEQHADEENVEHDAEVSEDENDTAAVDDSDDVEEPETAEDEEEDEEEEGEAEEEDDGDETRRSKVSSVRQIDVDEGAEPEDDDGVGVDGGGS